MCVHHNTTVCGLVLYFNVVFAHNLKTNKQQVTRHDAKTKNW